MKKAFNTEVFPKRGFAVTLFASAIVLQACAPSGPSYFSQVDVIATAQAETTVAPVGEIPVCNSSTLQWMIGQPEAVIAGVEFLGPVRVVGPDQAITMDYDETRTNFYVDVAGRITRVTCG